MITDIIVIYLYKKAYAYLYVGKCRSVLISEPNINLYFPTLCLSLKYATEYI